MKFGADEVRTQKGVSLQTLVVVTQIIKSKIDVEKCWGRGPPMKKKGYQMDAAKLNYARQGWPRKSRYGSFAPSKLGAWESQD